MSVSSLSKSAIIEEKSDIISDEVLTINNNVKLLKLGESVMRDVQESPENDSQSSVDSENAINHENDDDLMQLYSNQSPYRTMENETIKNNGQVLTFVEDLTDDTASDSRSAEGILMSENSGRMYETDDITFDDDELSSIARSNSVDYLKEKAIVMLQQELENARKELELKDEKCKELTGVRSKVEAELEELTASLFEEAHKMVHDANMGQYIADKKLKAAQGQIEALQTEISALKALVLTSTPSSPNPGAHPQLIKKKKKDLLGSPLRKHMRNKSDADTRSLQSPTKEIKPIVKVAKEIDSVMMNQLSDWLRTIPHATPPVNHSKSEATSVSNHNARVEVDCDATEYVTMTPITPQLLNRIDREDINPCLTFSHTSLSQKVLENVRNNSLTIEPISKPVMQQCALSGAMVCCKHQIKYGDSDQFYPVSLSCRTRIASVCDFLTYIRYIEKGIVKHTSEQMYWEINRLRREMSLAKLGYYKEE